MKPIYSFIRKTKLHFLFVLLLAAAFHTGAQVTYSFTTAGATGSVGPTQAQVTAAYGSTNLNNMVISNGGIQSFTVPITGVYQINIAGAQGGNTSSQWNHAGGLGSRMQGDFALNSGDVLRILVGQQAASGSGGQGGGGGTFVTSNNVLLIAAGGGGGATYDYGGGNSTTLTAGTNDSPGGSISGGINGNGGDVCNGAFSVNEGGGGGGYQGNGSTAVPGLSGFTDGGGGFSFANGGTGGTGDSPGGFGGGGATSITVGGGGGGGYSGGAGGQQVGDCSSSLDRTGGGGGGSYNTGNNPVNTAGVQTGDGYAVITSLCNINLTSTSTLICTGTTVTLTTNAISNYSWSTGNTTSSVIVVSPSVTTTYSVFGVGTFPSGCQSGALLTVTVNNTPTVSIASSTTSACLGQTVGLTASGANTYTWSTSSNSAALSLTPSATTPYTVTGANACGTATAGVTITVSALPVTAVASSTLVCSGTGASLTASGATNYTWSPGSSVSNPFIVSPTANTTYTIVGKTGNCFGSSTIVINTKPNPTLSASTSNSVICSGDGTNLSVTGDALTYTWSPGNQSGTSISVNPTLTTLYSVTGTNSVNCISSVSQVILVNPNPMVNATASNSTVCSGGASTLTASGADTYSWTSTPNTATLQVYPLASTVYSVTGSYSTGCMGTATVDINVLTPTLAVSVNTAVCSGSHVVISAGGADSYTWSNGSMVSSTNVSPTLTTVYTVTGSVTDPNTFLSCDASNYVQVTVNANPTISVVSNHSVICLGTSAVLAASGAGTYTWTGGSGAVADVSISVSPIANQTYSVTGIDENGCAGKATILIQVSTCNGIATVQGNAALLIYPNPSAGEFTISSDQDMILYLTNELGQQVKTITLNSANRKVNVSNLANGVYFITGSDANGSAKEKIIVTK